MDVSIIIVNWNTRDILKDCLNSIYRHTDGIGFEVIVVDNGSEDGSCGMVKDYFPNVVLIENPQNRGFAAANNQAMRIARGRNVLLLNSDTLVLDGAIVKTVAFADANPAAAVVGCRVLDRNGTVQQSCFMFPSITNLILAVTYLYKLFPRSRFFARERMGWWDGNDVRQVDAVAGCFMLVARRAIEQTGMMDERFFMYGEETDWCYRFKQAGWKVMFTPDGEIIHLGAQSTRKSEAEMLIELRMSILKFFEKHRGRFEHRTACILIVLFLAIRTCIWGIVAVLPLPKSKQARVKVRAYTTSILQIRRRPGIQARP
ncbi:MAG TPA: glycosyltransferase family 2 protein [Sedimentisphaerales bacterium]|nr:glycosyltransferase family 2 protein [Sedimentisphaerales bacterium]